jgi:hypothetical protein
MKRFDSIADNFERDEVLHASSGPPRSEDANGPRTMGCQPRTWFAPSISWRLKGTSLQDLRAQHALREFFAALRHSRNICLQRLAEQV